MTALTLEPWLLCLGFAIALLWVDAVIKVFLHRRSGANATPESPALAMASKS